MDKIKTGLTAGAIIALVTFFSSIFDARYVLRAEYSESKSDIEVIKEKISSINEKLDEIKTILKEK